MKVSEVLLPIELVAPPALAEPWDNVGLQVGDADAEVADCLLALDVSPETVREARRVNAGLIIAHHPVILPSLAAVTAQSPAGATVLAAARAGLSVYVAHTNLDAAPGIGTAAVLAARLGLKPGPPLVFHHDNPGEGGGPSDGEDNSSAAQEETAAPPGAFGLGMLCEAPEIALGALAEYVAGKLGRREVGMVGDADRPVRRIALAPGSGGALVERAARRADVIVTGEVKYHDALCAAQLGLAVLAAGHYDTERPVLDALARLITDHCGARLGVAISQTRTDPVSSWPHGA